MTNKIVFTIFIACITLFAYSCEKELSVAPEESKPDDGFIFISSYPEKAEIFLNGRRTGSFTPDSITWLKDGTQTITLKKSLYRDTSFQVTTAKGTRNVVDIQYLQNPLMFGKINCVSDPENALVYIDGVSTGLLTPVTIPSIIPGNHSVTYGKTGYWEGSKNVLVKSNQISLAQLALEDTSVWVTFDISNSGIASPELTCIEIDENNTKWIGTTEDGIILYDEISWKQLTKENSLLPDNYITFILIDTDYKKYIGTGDGLVIIDGDSWRIINSDNSILPSNFISTLDINSNGDMMIGTQAGLVRYFASDDRWLLLNDDNSAMPSSWVNEIKYQTDSDFWAALLHVGLARFKEGQWKTYGYPNPMDPSGGSWKDPLPTEMFKSISAVGFGQNGKVWFCSNDNQSANLLLYNNGEWSIPFPLGSNTINTIFVDDQDYVWLCTYKGLIKYRLNVSPFTHYNILNSGLRNLVVTDIAKDRNGIMWITTLGGGLTKKKN
ncbi:MAG: PEGA domain-containing protein [bacterium]